MEKPKRWTIVFKTSLKEGPPLIDWLMGVEQNSVYLSIILVVGCTGLSECEELVRGCLQEMMGLDFVDSFM